MKSLTECILERRSVRSYSKEPVKKEDVERVLTAATWAPSGNNLQPWKFSVIMENNALIQQLAELTVYRKWVETAPCLIAVFLDKQYLDAKLTQVEMKHHQAVGAAIQNMLLAAHDLDLGTCWIGEILKNEEVVCELLGASKDLQLMAVITLGHQGDRRSVSKRKTLEEVVLNWL